MFNEGKENFYILSLACLLNSLTNNILVQNDISFMLGDPLFCEIRAGARIFSGEGAVFRIFCYTDQVCVIGMDIWHLIVISEQSFNPND